jgi:rubrerythrin
LISQLEVFFSFTDYQQFLALAQAFEDTGVRAYKGQAANLMSKPDLLTAALQIHSVEARHASEVRRLRGQKDGLLVKIVEDCGSGSRNL